MTKRKQISKKLRFEVFHRDEFSCQYCGATPPSAVLHVDHIIAVKNGGLNDIDNLITSCDACNLGKGVKSLTDIPASLQDRARDIAEREDQLRCYNEILLLKSQRIDAQAWSVVRALENDPELRSYSMERFKSIKKFVELLPVSEVIDAAEITLLKSGLRKKDSAFKYFCAVCWNKIRSASSGEN